jgi:inorganic phosphate transporter, PiT family
LLPVDLILKVGSTSGFAMVFALLVAAIIWNLGTWYLGLPSSSSHTLIGSIVGVGIANQLIAPTTGTSSVDWAQAIGVGKSLLLSPLVGFLCAALLFLAAKVAIPRRELYVSPVGTAPPPWWVRLLLILTCTGVSFAHGSNDGQKGMGLIMLILIGTVPTTYALNRAVPPTHVHDFIALSAQAADALASRPGGAASVTEPRQHLTAYIRSRSLTPSTVPAAREMIRDIGRELGAYNSLREVPPERVRNFRNDLYIVNEALRLLQSSSTLRMIATRDADVIRQYRRQVDIATKFIPDWVKVAVAIALGLGTMIGWKRIVVTVGEKIGKQHLTYAQGAAAEITAMATIGAADAFGLPVSTTHVLSSGVAGTMAANASGLQWNTIRNLLMAWVLTLPVSILLSGALFWVFRTLAV